MVLLGCSGLFRDKAEVQVDIQEHLRSTYGEAFVITQLNSQGYSGGRFPDKYNYTAYPRANPDIVFRGTADYEARPDEVTDRYSCAKVEHWLPAAFEKSLGPGYRLGRTQISCHPDDGLQPQHPPRTPFPPKVVSMKTTLETYAEGDPQQTAEEARVRAREVAAHYNVFLRGTTESYPAALWPFVSTWSPPKGVHAQPAEDWHTMILAEAALKDDPPAELYVRLPEREAVLRELASELFPEASVSVWARPGELRRPDARPKVDVRIAQAGLDRTRVETLRERLKNEHRDTLWHLRAIDTNGVDQPQSAGFSCGALQCVPVTDPLIHPDLLRPALQSEP